MRKKIEAAAGWLSLGDPDEAWEELETLSAKEREHGDVVALRVGILFARGDWLESASLAFGLLRREPWRVEVRFLTARCLCRLDMVEEARVQVWKVAEQKGALRGALLACEDLAPIWNRTDLK